MQTKVQMRVSRIFPIIGVSGYDSYKLKRVIWVEQVHLNYDITVVCTFNTSPGYELFVLW